MANCFRNYNFDYYQSADIECSCLNYLSGCWTGSGIGEGTCNEFPLVYDGGSIVVLVIAENGCFGFQTVSNDNDIYLPIETENEVTNASCYGEIDVSINSDCDGDGILDFEDSDIDGDGILNEEDECQTCGCTGEVIISILEDEDYLSPYTVYVSSEKTRKSQWLYYF